MILFLFRNPWVVDEIHTDSNVCLVWVLFHWANLTYSLGVCNVTSAVYRNVMEMDWSESEGVGDFDMFARWRSCFCAYTLAQAPQFICV